MERELDMRAIYSEHIRCAEIILGMYERDIVFNRKMAELDRGRNQASMKSYQAKARRAARKAENSRETLAQLRKLAASW